MRAENINSSRDLIVICVEYMQFRGILNDSNLKIGNVDDYLIIRFVTLERMIFLQKGVSFEIRGKGISNIESFTLKDPAQVGDKSLWIDLNA